MRRSLAFSQEHATYQVWILIIKVCIILHCEITLKLLYIWPAVQLLGEVGSWLRVQMPICIRDLYEDILVNYLDAYNDQETHSITVNLAILDSSVNIIAFRPGDVNDPVDNNMRNMNSLWSKLSGQALARRPESKLSTCKRRHGC